MKRVIVYCEGPTEETFVNQILSPFFVQKDIFMTATSFDGVSKYSIIKKKLSDLCKSDKSAVITTMLDYYGLPSDTPGKNPQYGIDIYERVEHVEECIKQDIGLDNLLPNIIMHEFEALLFSKPECFEYCELPKGDIKKLCDMRVDAETPEHINNSPNTAPSKRILAVYPEYSKVIDGYNIAFDIGLSTMRNECKHFDKWLSSLEKIKV